MKPTSLLFNSTNKIETIQMDSIILTESSIIQTFNDFWDFILKTSSSKIEVNLMLRIIFKDNLKSKNNTEYYYIKFTFDEKLELFNEIIKLWYLANEGRKWDYKI